jgi:hypothetical protein
MFGTDMNTNWSVLVVFEGTSAREPAVAFCDELVQRFWRRTRFELAWLDWTALRETSSANRATLTAREADMFVLATGQAGKVNPHVKSWLELALRNRGEREGVLVGLSAAAALTDERAGTQQYLRKLAHQNGLDYLETVPTSLSRGVPETAEAYQLRATQVTSVLDTILHRVPPRRML